MNGSVIVVQCYSPTHLPNLPFTTRHDSGGMFVVHIVSVHSLQLLSDLKDRMWDKKVCVCMHLCMHLCLVPVCVCICNVCTHEQCWLSS